MSIAGLVIAVVIAFLPDVPDWLVWALLVIGVFAGWFRISKESEVKFFVLAIALLIFGDALDDLPTIGPIFTDILESMALFVGAAVVSVLARNMWRWVT